MAQPKTVTDFNTLYGLLEGNLESARQAELASQFQAHWAQIAHRGRQLREIAQELDDPDLTARFQEIQQQAAQVRRSAAEFHFPDPCQGCGYPVYDSHSQPCPTCDEPTVYYVCGNCRTSVEIIPRCLKCG